jgi:hypothetical protein
VAYTHDVGQVCIGTASLILRVFIQNEKTTLWVAKQSFQNTLYINCEVSNNEMMSVFLPFIYLFTVYLTIISTAQST